MPKGLNGMFVSSVVLILVLAGDLHSAPLVIKDWSSKGGRTQNKTGPKDIMYLVKAGDKITFTVTADGAEKYEWQLNKKVQKEVKGNSFTWTVPDEKDIWEIHLKATGGGEQAHEEWVVSTLSKKEAPDFFDYFSDMKCQKRSEKDPWDRPLPEWSKHGSLGNVSKGFIDGAGFDRMAKSDAAYGTWKFTFQCPNGYMSTGGGSTYLHYYYIMGGLEAFDYSVATDTHHHATWWHHGGGRTCFHMDAGFHINKEWRDVKIIRTPDGYFYTYLDGVLESRWPEPTGTTCRKVRMRKAGPFKVPANVIYADNLEIYKDKYFFPPRSARYERYITNWGYRGKRVLRGGNWVPTYVPAKRTGVVIRGRGVRLKDVAEMLNKPSLFKYDPRTRTAICRTNLVVDDAAELIVEDETLKIRSPKAGEHEFAVMYGSTLRVKNSTITSENGNHFTWRFTSTTHFGFTAGWILGLKPGREGITPKLCALSYRSLQTILFDKSTINNCSYMFFDAPHELRITDTKITNLHEVDTGEYSACKAASLETVRRKEFVRGKKALWVFYKNGDMFDFAMRNVTLSGRKHPLNVTFMLNNAGEMVNVYDMDLRNENIRVRHSCQMGSFWYPNTKHYDSTLGIVNCRFANILVLTGWAWAVPKYYLDVKVVDANGAPVSGATVSVANEADDAKYPPENMISRRIYSRNRRGFFVHYRFFSYTPLRSTATGPDGHTPPPSDKAKTIILPDFVQDKSGRKEFKYTITVEKAGKKKVITTVNPGPGWYRSDPNKPTYTITAVFDGKTVTEAELKTKGLAGPAR